MEGLNLENILGGDEVDNLFTDAEEIEKTPTTPEKNEEGNKESEETEENNTTETVIDSETLFEEEQPESVGSEDKAEKGKEDATTDEDDSTSPQNFYSSIANALAVDGIFPNLDVETIKKADTAEGLSDLIEAEVNARLEEKQLRVSKALENGVEPLEIKRYENTLNYIASVTDAQLVEESEKGETLRRNIIFQDFLNKGYSQEKAQKFTDRAIDAGTDIEDAKEALQSNKEYFQDKYNELLKNAQEEADKERTKRKKQAEQLKTSLMEDEKLFGDMDISKETRRKAYESISKPIYKDPDSGEYLTAIQKYEIEHRSDFLKYIGLFFSMTDGFKDFESFTKGKVRKEMKKGLRELESTLRNPSRVSSGNLNMITRSQEEDDTLLGKGLRISL